MSAVVPGVDVASAEAVGPNTVNDSQPSPDCGRMQGPRGCPGPRGPQGPQPPLSDAVDSERSDQASSSRAVKTAYDAALAAAEAVPALSSAVDSDAEDVAASSLAIKTVYASIRIPCMTPLTLHVRLDGDDANDGLSGTSAKRTLSGALAELPRYDARDTVTYINIGPGAFNIGVLSLDRRVLSGHNRLDIRGAGQAETILYHDQDQNLIRTYNSDVRLYDLTCKGGVYAADHSLVALNNVSLETDRSNVVLLLTQTMALAYVSESVTARGDCRCLFLAQRNGCVYFTASSTLTLRDTPHYSQAVADAAGGTIFWEGSSQGACTGVKYKESWGGRVLTNGDPNLVIPGSVDGA